LKAKKILVDRLIILCHKKNAHLISFNQHFICVAPFFLQGGEPFLFLVIQFRVVSADCQVYKQ
jgi:hypothetical protein